MKLNVKQERLFKVLLSANPILTNCKGSVKAVRMFMNMLGFTCTFDRSKDTHSMNIYVKNVQDLDLSTVKSILAKQLQEILPINVSVGPENIIGTGA